MKPRNGGQVWGTCHDERVMTGISKAKHEQEQGAKQEQIKSNKQENVCELTDAKKGLANNF